MTLSNTLDERAHALAFVTHELRSPLAVALDSLHVLRLLSSDGGIRDKVCDRSERQLRNMAALVEDLLELSRADLGKLYVGREQLDLVRLVRTTVEDHSGAIRSAGLTVTLVAPPEPVWIAGDKLRLNQVFSNLLGNAEKFTHSGGSITISVSAEHAEGQVYVRVRDTGEGIEPDLMGSIFDPFVQAEQTAGRTNAELGLGLALVKRLTEMHGGTVEAFSDGPGQGAEFLVRLPLSAPGPQRSNAD